MKNDNSNLSCIAVSVVLAIVLGFVFFGRRSSQTSETVPASGATNVSASKGSATNGSNEITLQTSETYFDLAQVVARRWGNKNDQNPPVQLLEKEGSRDAMQHLLNPSGGRPRPDLWLTSSKSLIDDLVAASGNKLVNRDDSANIGILPPQPLVFLVKKNKQAELDAYLTQEHPLDALPEGKFHFASADLLKSGGGDSTAQYLKWDAKYWLAQQAGKAQSFEAYLQHLKAKGFEKRLEDSGTLAAEFAQDPRLDFILVHNTLADREFNKANGSLYKIVPKLTVFETPALVVLKSEDRARQAKLVEFVKYFVAHSDFPTVSGANAIDDQGDVNNEKRVWERVFNQGKRL